MAGAGIRDNAPNHRAGGLVIAGSPSRTSVLVSAGVGWAKSGDYFGEGFMVLADGSVTYTNADGTSVTATFKANAQVPVLVGAITNASAVDVLVFLP